MEIEGKRVLITGAGRGLGHTLVFAFASAGAKEVLAGVRRPESINQLNEEARVSQTHILPFKLDVTNQDDVQLAVERGPIDILVNNAGVAAFGNPLTMSLTDIQKELDVNYFGVLRMVRAFAPGMSKRAQGVIVNVGSILGRINLPMVGTYCASKAALLSLGQALRAYLSESNIRVITVLPSTIDTDMSSGADVNKLSKEFVAAEILQSIRKESHDPAIGEEARGILEGLSKDPVAVEKMFAQFK